jgi:hypothetical protein
MEGTSAGDRLRARTAAWLAMALVASASAAAHAQDHTEPPAIQVEEQVQPASPPRPQQSAPPREDGPRVITHWHEGEPIPPGYHPAQRTRTGAIIGGAVTLGALYLLTAFVASVWTDIAKAEHESNPVTGLFVPVFGPFITMTQSSSATGDFFLILDGLGQTTGAILLAWGLASPQTVLVRDGYFGKPWLLPRPMLLGKSGAGFGLSGAF